MNFWLNIARTALGLGIKVGILFILGWFFSFHLVTWQPSILYWVDLLFFGVDICFYFHRCEHYSRILWVVHVTHHSSQEFNLTTGFRSSVFLLFVSFWFFIPLVIIGFHPLIFYWWMPFVKWWHYSAYPLYQKNASLVWSYLSVLHIIACIMQVNVL